MTPLQRLEAQLEQFRRGEPLNAEELQSIGQDVALRAAEIPDDEKQLLLESFERVAAAIEFQMNNLGDQLSSTREWTQALKKYAALRSFKTGQNLNRRV